MYNNIKPLPHLISSCYQICSTTWLLQPGRRPEPLLQLTYCLFYASRIIFYLPGWQFYNRLHSHAVYTVLIYYLGHLYLHWHNINTIYIKILNMFIVVPVCLLSTVMSGNKRIFCWSRIYCHIYLYIAIYNVNINVVFYISNMYI